ncbi:MAG TPA: BNR-4 repeat-containing protein [Verrucomicrobiae bacterium]|nr:BNR-4 repeat-containing protein [Verrucomicrobiae bacterium]
MPIRSAVPPALIAAIAIASGVTARALEPSPPESPPLFGGCGGAYLLAAPGPLEIEVVKRDRNTRDGASELRAILFGPDRSVLAEARIPDDGRPKGSGMGPVQTVRLSAKAERRGIYGLMITMSGDRYGETAVWGFRSNCPRYLIETARGHKDARHEEPIVLFSPDRPASICFLPRRGPFALELKHRGAGGTAELRDASGKSLASFPIQNGTALGQITAAVPRGSGPWRLIVPAGESIAQIDGVTRWENGDPFPDMACWTPQPDSWFAATENHWLLTPYRRLVYSSAASQGKVTLRAHNNATRGRAINLAVEFPDGPWPAALSTNRVALEPKKSADISLSFTAPPGGESRTCHVRATSADDSSVSTYVTVTIRSGEPPARKPLHLPITLRAFEHENEQFGHLPGYPHDAEIYFDAKNHPFTLDGGKLATPVGRDWTRLPIAARPDHADPNSPAQSFSPLGSKVAFDRANNLYLLGTTGSRRALLRSADGGMSFAACDLPRSGRGSASFDIEQFSGHNMPDGPPPIVRYTLTATDPKLFWRRVHDIELLLARDTEKGMVFDRPIAVSTQGIGLAMHSGIPATLASRGDRTHICWGEATDPATKVPGVPAFVATFDRKANRLGPPSLIGYGAPANDIHNTPSLTIDGNGLLHAIGGTHGRPFPYAASLRPDDAAGGLTPPATTGDDLSQTYIGMVCGPDGSLHTAFRLWQRNKDPFPLSSYATLAYQRKRPGQPWEPPKILIVPPISEYSVFYHRLTIDRKGRLFLSYDYWSTFWFYRNDHLGRRRSLLMSPDGGDSWKLAEDRDLIGYLENSDAGQ